MNSWHNLPAVPIFSPVMALASDTETLWAGGVGGIACYDGHAWTVPTGRLPVSSVSALCLSGDALLAGGPEGIAFSLDRGQTWEMTLGSDNAPVSAFLAKPGFPCLAATLGRGVLHSKDGGKSWEPAGEGIENLEVLSLAWHADAILRDGILLAATTNGIYRSTDGGQSWQPAPGTDGLVISGVAFLPGDPLAALSAPETGRLLISYDSGATWEPFETTGLPVDAEINTFAAASDGSLLAGTANSGTLRSLDSGRTWETLMEEGALSLHYGEAGLYAGLADGAALYTAGRLERLPAPPLNDLRALLYARGHLYAAGLQSGLWRWSGEAWQNFPSPIDYITAVSPTPTGALVLAGTKALFRSNDDGQTWDYVSSAEMPIDQITFRAGQYPVGRGAAGSTQSRTILVTEDDGQTWQPADLPFEGLPLAALNFQNNMLAAATYNPQSATAQLWSSADNGQTWRRGMDANTNWGIINLTEPPGMISLGGMMIIQQPGGGWRQSQVGHEGNGILRTAGDGINIAALTSEGLLHTADFGKSWAVVSGAPETDDVYDLLVKDGKIILLLTSGQVMQLDLS
jgi:photosystem II stability/assembly factor-like uncharacterized protein